MRLITKQEEREKKKAAIKIILFVICVYSVCSSRQPTSTTTRHHKAMNAPNGCNLIICVCACVCVCLCACVFASSKDHLTCSKREKTTSKSLFKIFKKIEKTLLYRKSCSRIQETNMEYGRTNTSMLDRRTRKKTKEKGEFFKKCRGAKTKKRKIEKEKSIWSMLPSTALASSSTIPSPKVKNPVWSGGRSFTSLPPL